MARVRVLALLHDLVCSLSLPNCKMGVSIVLISGCLYED